MNRPETTQALSAFLERHIKARDTRVYWAKEVTFDYVTAHPIRVDYMRFKPRNTYTTEGIENGDFYCYEVKSSVEDFHSPNGHNFIGDFNYYVMPQEVMEKVRDEIPPHVGVYIPSSDRWRSLESAKKAKRVERKRPTVEMLLMMFRSAARDRR